MPRGLHAYPAAAVSIYSHPARGATVSLACHRIGHHRTPSGLQRLRDAGAEFPRQLGPSEEATPHLPDYTDGVGDQNGDRPGPRSPR